jgi:hypothetical protein
MVEQRACANANCVPEQVPIREISSCSQQRLALLHEDGADGAHHHAALKQRRRQLHERRVEGQEVEICQRPRQVAVVRRPASGAR